MTNNENKIDKEKAIELIAGRIDDEFKKHPQLNWQKIAASKIHSQWFEQSQSALEEKEMEIIGLRTLIELNESDLTTKDKEIEELKDEIENDRLSAVVDAKTIVRLEERIKELEEGIDVLLKYMKDRCNYNCSALGCIYSGVCCDKYKEVLLSPSKEQKEGEGE